MLSAKFQKDVFTEKIISYEQVLYAIWVYMDFR